MIDNCLLYFLYSVIILSTLIIIILLNNSNENDSSLLVPVTSTIGLGSILTLTTKYLSNNNDGKNSKQINSIMNTRQKNNIVKIGFGSPMEEKNIALQNEQNSIIEKNNIIFELIKFSGLSKTLINLEISDIYNTNNDIISNIYNELEQSSKNNTLKYNLSECYKQILKTYISELQSIINKAILSSKDIKIKLQSVKNNAQKITTFSTDFFDRDAIIKIINRKDLNIDIKDIIVKKEAFSNEKVIDRFLIELDTTFQINLNIITNYLKLLKGAYIKYNNYKHENVNLKNTIIPIEIEEQQLVPIEIEKQPLVKKTSVSSNKQVSSNKRIAKGENDKPVKLFDTKIFKSVIENYVEYENNIDFIKNFNKENICEINVNDRNIINNLNEKLQQLNDLNIEYYKKMVELFILFIYNNNRYIIIKNRLEKCGECFNEIETELRIYQNQISGYLNTINKKDKLIRENIYTIDEYKSQIENLKLEYADKIKELEREHIQKIEEFNEIKVSEIDKLNKLNSKKIEELTDLHNKTIIELNKTNKIEIDKIDLQIKLLEDKSSKLELSIDEKNERITNLNIEISQLNTEHATKIRELNASHITMIEELKKTHAEEIEELKKKYDYDLKEFIKKSDESDKKIKESQEARILKINEEHKKAFQKQKELYEKYETNIKLDYDRIIEDNSRLKKENSDISSQLNINSLNKNKIQEFSIYVRDTFEKEILYYFKSALANKDNLNKNNEIYTIEINKLNNYLLEIEDDNSEKIKKQSDLLNKILKYYKQKDDFILSFGIDKKDDEELLNNIKSLKALIDNVNIELNIDLLLNAHLNSIYNQILLYTNINLLNNIIKITNKFSDSFIFKYEISKEYLKYLNLTTYEESENINFIKITHADLVSSYLYLLPNNKNMNQINNNLELNIQLLDNTNINSLRSLFDFYYKFVSKSKIINNDVLNDAIKKLDKAGDIYKNETERLLKKEDILDKEFQDAKNDYNETINQYINDNSINQYINEKILSDSYVKETFNKIISKIKKKPNTNNIIIQSFLVALNSNNSIFNLFSILNVENDLTNKLQLILEFINFLLTVNSNIIAFLFKENKEKQIKIDKINKLLENCEEINQKNLELEELSKKNKLLNDEEIKKLITEISKLKSENQELIQTINNTNGILYKKFNNIIPKEKLVYVSNTTIENYINKIYEFIEFEINNLKSSNLEKTNEIKMLKDQLDKQKEDLLQRLENKQTELNACVQRESDLKAYITKLEDDRTKLVATTQNLITNDLEQKLTSYETKLKQLQDRVLILQDNKFTVNMALQEKDTAITEKLRIESELTSEKSKLVKLEAEITQLLIKIDEKNKEILNNNSMIDKIRNELQIQLPLNELVNVIIKDFKLYKEQAIAISGLTSSNELLNIELQSLKSNTDANLANLETRKKELLKQLAIYKISLSVKDSKIKNIEEAQVKLISENTIMKVDIESKIQRILFLENEQKELNSKIVELNKSNSELQNDADVSNRKNSQLIKDIELLNKKNAELLQRIDSLQIDLDNSTKILENDTRRLQEEIDNAGIVSKENINKLMIILRTNLSTIIKLKIKNNTLTKQIETIQTENDRLKAELIQNEDKMVKKMQINTDSINEKNSKIQILESENKIIQRELLANKGQLSLIRKEIESQKTKIQNYVLQSGISEQEISVLQLKIQELEMANLQLIETNKMQESDLSTKYSNSQSELKTVKTELENKIAEFNKLKNQNNNQNNLNSFNNTSELLNEIKELKIVQRQLEIQVNELRLQKSQELLKLEQQLTITIRQLIKDKDKLNNDKLANDKLNQEYNKKIQELEIANLQLIETNKMQESEFYIKYIECNQKLKQMQLELKNKISELEKSESENKTQSNLNSFNKTSELINEIKEFKIIISELEKQLTNIKLQKSQELLNLENEYIIKIKKLIKDKEFLEGKNMSNEELNDKFNNKIKDISEELSAIKAENGSLKQTIEELKKINDTLEFDKTQLNKNNELLSTTIKQIKIKLNDVEELLQNNELKYNDDLKLKLTQTKAKCVTDLFILEGKHKIVMQLLNKKETQLKDCNEMKERIELSLSKEIDKYKNEKFKDSEKIINLEELLRTNKTKNELLQSELDYNLAKYNEKYSQLNSKIIDLNTQITNLQYNNDDLDNDKKTLQKEIELQLDELQENYKNEQQKLQKIIINLSKFSNKNIIDMQYQLKDLNELNEKYINDINNNKNNNIKLQFEKLNLLNKIKQLQQSIYIINNSNSQNIKQLQNDAFEEITRLKLFIKQKENELLQSKEKSFSNETNLLKSIGTISQKENELIKSKTALLNLDKEFKIKEQEIIQLRDQIMQFEIKIKQMQMYLDQVKLKNTDEHAIFLEKISKLKIINSNLESKLEQINKSKLIIDNDYEKQIKLCENKLNKNIKDLDTVSANLSKCKIELDKCTNNINIKNSINKKLEDSINISNSKIYQLESDKKNLEDQLNLLKEILSKSNDNTKSDKYLSSSSSLSLDPVIPNDTHIIYKYINSEKLNNKLHNIHKLYNTPYDKYATDNGLNTNLDTKLNINQTPYDQYNAINN